MNSFELNGHLGLVLSYINDEHEQVVAYLHDDGFDLEYLE